MTEPFVEQEWKSSRAGARAGSGFRFQDAATAAAAVGCWAGSIDGLAVVPEGLDDFSIEAAQRTLHVQVKSKVRDDTHFSPNELLTILRASVRAGAARAIIIDRRFAGEINTAWCRSIADSPTWRSALMCAHAEALSRPLDGQAQSAIPASSANTSATPAAEDATEVIDSSTLITWCDPVADAAEVIARKRGVALAAAVACVHRLVHVIGERADANATRSFAERVKITVGEVDREIDRILGLIDVAAIEAAPRRGIAELVSFAQELAEPRYYEGISTAPGHVTAGLALPRDALVDELLGGLASAHRLLIVGPSGSGKSAAAWLAVFRMRHAWRCIQILRCSAEDREDLQRFVDAQAPSERSPIILYIDDAGRGKQFEWGFACDLTLSTPGIFALGSAREEDLAILPCLADSQQVRPVLDEALAQPIWERMRASNLTTWPYWKEPLEQSGKLLLEYVHILTQGRRLSDVVEEQVKRRLTEGRHAEFEILRLTSAAGSLGASVSASLVAERSGLGAAAFAGALQRLINEHLLRRSGEDELDAMHPLRAACIFETCLELAPGARSHALAETLALVTAEGVRYLIARAIRAGEMTVEDATAALATRLAARAEPAVLTGALEGLKIATLDRDAELFVELAKRHGFDPAHYFVIMIALNTTLGEDMQSTNLAIRKLAQIRKEFHARQAADLRMPLVETLSADAWRNVVAHVRSAEQMQRLVRGLVGLPPERYADMLVSGAAVLREANIGELAATLAIAYDVSPALAKRWAEALGGERVLLDRLWQETPWALRPVVAGSGETNVEEGSSDVNHVEVRADLLAVAGDLIECADPVVYDHAARAIALAPSADTVTARPLPITGEPIVIGEFSMGVKRFGRANVASRATVMWNRMLVHAAAARVATEPMTHVMQRRKETLAIAARLFRKHADGICRGRKLKQHEAHELKALEIVEQIAPALPLDRPEQAISIEGPTSLTDPTEQLIVDVRRACERVHDPSARGAALAAEMESIVKAVQSCRKELRWSYVGGAPDTLLQDMANLAEDLRQIFLSEVPLAASHDAWKRGSGVKHALDRAQRSAEHQAGVLIERLAKSLSGAGVIVSAIAARVYPSANLCWPDLDVCVLAACDRLEDFYMWLASRIVDLQAEVGKVNSLTVAPVVVERIATQCAARIHARVPVLPETAFEESWGVHCRLPMFKSATCAAFDHALEGILSLNATKELLAGKDLLPPEHAFTAACEERIGEALSAVEMAMHGADRDMEIAAAEYLVRVIRDSETRSATDTARRVLLGTADDSTEVLALRMNLIERELKRVSSDHRGE